MAPHPSESVAPSPSTDGQTFPGLPPFPSDVPTAPLLVLSLGRLRNDKAESKRLFQASKDLGFFYLDLRNDKEGEELLQEADRLFAIGKELFDQGREELSKYDYTPGTYFGYKGFGKGLRDENGQLDRNEFYNAGKDDFLGQSANPLVHPPLLNTNAPLLQSYMRHSHSVLSVVLDQLTAHLELPSSTLANLHRQTALSGDHIRFIKAPPQPQDDLRTAMAAHADYGTLALLINRLGGLQVLLPESSEWSYIRPLPGHAVVNLGDTLVTLTNGLLRSNLHRVAAPPGAQLRHTRYSLVYFVRPEDEVLLKRLGGGNIPPLAEGTVEESLNTREWIQQKTMSNRKARKPAAAAGS